MTSIPSRSQVYEDRSFDNPGYGADTDEASIHGSSFPRRPPRKKSRGNSPSDETPVVYIDLQEMTGNSSTVASPSSPPDQGYGVPHNHNDFVQNTIFYNPFEDSSNSKGIKSPVSETSSTTTSSPQPTQRLPPPNRLYLNRIETTAQSTPNLHQIPNLSIREIQPQRFIPDDGFTLTPIAVNEFPEPPPAYTEVDRPRHMSTPSVPDTIINIPPPPTQGFTSTNNPTLVSTNRGRKIMFCPRCGMRVQTLVVKQPGIGTHWIACILLMFCLLPCVCLVYCLDWCKHKNHYCPNCNHMIGFEGLCHKKISVK